MNVQDRLIKAGSIACIAGCVADIIMIIVLGVLYPGYNHIAEPVSILGAEESPVSDVASLWWIILGFVFVFFAFAFLIRFRNKGFTAYLAFVLLILYALGEDMGSGIFKTDKIMHNHTVTGLLHNFISGAGLVSALIFPLVMIKLSEGENNRRFRIISLIVFITGVVLFIIFQYRYIDYGNRLSDDYKGLWQRLLLLVFYVYITVTAVRMSR